MKKTTLIAAALTFAFATPAAFAAMDHGSMNMDHGSGSMKMDQGGHMMGKTAHEEVVEGVKATFSVLDIKAKMKEMGMKETHHIMVMFTDAKTGKMLNGGEATIKVIAPDKTDQVKNLMGMEGGFGSDFTMPKKGKYGVMCKFKLTDGRVRQSKFWYTVK
jgi:Spy/CpxP family protein refolding chaperone